MSVHLHHSPLRFLAVFGTRPVAIKMVPVVLVLREKTERPKAEAAGATHVVGTEAQSIVSETYQLLDEPAAYARMASVPNPCSDGHGAERIADTLLEFTCDLD